MKVQVGVNQKMKLYNVYRLCKQNVDFIKNIKIVKDEKDANKFVITNWKEIEIKLKLIRKIPILKVYVDCYFDIIPIFIREKSVLEFSNTIASRLISQQKNICDRMNTILDLYESMHLGDGGNGIDVKMPPCNDLKDYISYLKDIEFIFSQCPFLQCENEVLKFDSVDVGSNWLRLTIATASTCMILNNTAALVDKALILRSHYTSIRQQEELLKSQQNKNELSKEIIESYKFLHDTYMNAAISMLERDLGDLKDPEERDKTERSLEKLESLLEKGCEIYATLDAPDDVQTLFPEIQSNLELPDSIVKYIEEKEQQ